MGHKNRSEDGFGRSSSRPCGSRSTAVLAPTWCAGLALALCFAPCMLVSCSGGGSDEPEVTSRRPAKKRPSTRRPQRASRDRDEETASSRRPRSGSDLEDEVYGLLRDAKSAGADSLLATSYRNAKKYYDDGLAAAEEGDEKKAASRFARAKRTLTTLLGDLEELEKGKSELDALAKEAEEAKKKALEAGADTLAAIDFRDATEVLESAVKLRSDAESAGEVKRAKDDYKTAIDLFTDAVTIAGENQAQAKLAEAELAAMKRYKDQAKEQGADAKAITDWMVAERSERAAHAELEQGRFRAAIQGFQQAAASYTRALQNTVTAEQMQEIAERNEAAQKEYLAQQHELAEKRIEADKEARELALKARESAARARDTRTSTFQPLGSVPLGGSVEDFQAQLASQELRARAATFQPAMYSQPLDPDDEDFLRQNYKKLAPSLEYDPETGVAFVDYTSGAKLRAEFGDLVEGLQRKKYVSFLNMMMEDPTFMSFAGNTEGTFILPIPFRFRARVEWDMQIQTMDANGTFNSIVMWDPKKNHHYLTNWIHWGSSTGGARPKWVKMYPEKKYLQSANYWFDKTREIAMRVEFKMPGEDIQGDSPTLEEITSSATLTCTYDAQLDPVVNTFESRRPFDGGGFVGFKWNRVKFQVKRLKISGILHKELAVELLMKKMGVKSTKSSRSKSAEEKEPEEKPEEPQLESLLAPTGKPGKDDESPFDF